MSAEGKWDTVLNTPMGEQKGTLTLSLDGNKVSGKMEGAQGTLEFDNGEANGDDLTWSVDITNPMPLTLTFNVKVDGDNMEGEVALGPMGKAPMKGTRAA
ncbi:MAG: hypothetical protein AAF512_26845 [Pseudomonadota bacterium]